MLLVCLWHVHYLQLIYLGKLRLCILMHKIVLGLIDSMNICSAERRGKVQGKMKRKQKIWSILCMCLLPTIYPFCIPEQVDYRNDSLVLCKVFFRIRVTRIIELRTNYALAI
jgi:hypothetical protein